MGARVPRCKQCKYWEAESINETGRSFRHKCKASSRAIKSNEIMTSPKWCPLRVQSADEIICLASVVCLLAKRHYKIHFGCVDNEPTLRIIDPQGYYLFSKINAEESPTIAHLLDELVCDLIIKSVETLEKKVKEGSAIKV